MSGQDQYNPGQNQVPPSQYAPPAQPPPPPYPGQPGVNYQQYPGQPGAQFPEPPPPDYIGPPTQIGGGVGIAILITAASLLCMFFFPLLAPFAILGSTIWATVVASSRQFRKYRLGGPAGTASTCISCLLLWPIGYAWFLVNLYRVKTHRAELKQPGEGTRPSTIILMVLSGLTAIVLPAMMMLAAIALPNLQKARVRANEVTALTCLKNYASAQATYVKNQKRENPGYCNNFRALYYGESASGEPIVLISQRMADAFIEANGNVPQESSPYHGYVFLEDPTLDPDDWADYFALVAYPVKPGTTGEHMYWIGKEGQVLMKLAEADGNGNPVLLTPKTSPLSGDRSGWMDF